MNGDDTRSTDRMCLSRRQFLLAGGSVILLSTLPGFVHAAPALVKRYERRRIAWLSRLKQDVPVDFQYPSEAPSANFLVKLGRPAGGGVGPQRDVVAFNYFCTHMGGPLMGTYKAKHKAIGPCPFHLTTFDLTRHGIVIAGHATESLPQILLEAQGDAIYATGIIGLIYGQHSNLG